MMIKDRYNGDEYEQNRVQDQLLNKTNEMKYNISQKQSPEVNSVPLKAHGQQRANLPCINKGRYSKKIILNLHKKTSNNSLNYIHPYSSATQINQSNLSFRRNLSDQRKNQYLQFVPEYSLFLKEKRRFKYANTKLFEDQIQQQQQKLSHQAAITKQHLRGSRKYLAKSMKRPSRIENSVQIVSHREYPSESTKEGHQHSHLIYKSSKEIDQECIEDRLASNVQQMHYKMVRIQQRYKLIKH